MRAMSMAGRTIVLLLPVASFAGCLGAPVAIDPESMPHDHAVMDGSFSFEAKDCEEGGFVAAYQGQREYPGGWISADIYEEIGKPVHDSIGLPVVPGTHLNGNWHQGYRCASTTFNGETYGDFVFGRVGQMIQPPAFDPGGADFHFISTGFALGNGTIGDAFRDVTTADISHAYSTYVEWYLPKDLPRSAAYALFCDYEKGVYETYSDIEHYRAFEERTIRFWWTVPADGSESHIAHNKGTGAGGDGEPTTSTEVKAWNPVYWDIKTSGGHQYTTPPAGFEFGFHNKLSGEHGPAVTQPMMTNIYQHDALTFTYGGIIKDVVINELWTH